MIMSLNPVFPDRNLGSIQDLKVQAKFNRVVLEVLKNSDTAYFFRHEISAVKNRGNIEVSEVSAVYSDHTFIFSDMNSHFKASFRDHQNDDNYSILVSKKAIIEIDARIIPDTSELKRDSGPKIVNFGPYTLDTHEPEFKPLDFPEA